MESELIFGAKEFWEYLEKNKEKKVTSRNELSTIYQSFCEGK